jgi:hypothetical protein
MEFRGGRQLSGEKLETQGTTEGHRGNRGSACLAGGSDPGEIPTSRVGAHDKWGTRELPNGPERIGLQRSFDCVIVRGADDYFAQDDNS